MIAGPARWALAFTGRLAIVRAVALAVVVAIVLAFIGVSMLSEPDDTCIKVGGVVLGGKCP